MRTEEQFDSFYLKTRRALVHQTFALTGDLAAAQRAVRDAYVAAWHHWRKVKGLDDPLGWVRPRAWAQAQRRHTARLWRGTKDLGTDDHAVLEALHKLPVSERRALLLTELAGMSLDLGARELGVTKEALREQHSVAVARFAAVLDIDPGAVREPLGNLAGAASRAVLPRPAAVRREGRNRRRTHTVVAAAVATFLAVASGAFAHEPPTGDGAGDGSSAQTLAQPGELATTPSVPEPTLPSADDLLTVDDVEPLAPGRWHEATTHDNTGGDGMNYPCQQARFADTEGLGTLVRRLERRRGPGPSVTQVAEISASRQQAADTYDTIRAWFATCEDGRLHLERTLEIDGIAEQAELWELESWGDPRTSYAVSFAQVGDVVSTVVVRTVGGSGPSARKVARAVARSTELLCERQDLGDCGGRPRLDPAPPAPTTETKGMLATIDLPRLSDVRKPWVGTKASPAPRNPASTSCDRAEFRRAGAKATRTRTFLVPESRLPDRFGLTETYGRFGSPEKAKAFMGTVRDRFAGCEDRDLATDVLAPQQLRAGPLNGTTWRLETELSESRKVIYDVGFVRRGDTVAQLTFVPSEGADLGRGAFRALLERAGQRLGELD